MRRIKGGDEELKRGKEKKKAEGDKEKRREKATSVNQIAHLWRWAI